MPNWCMNSATIKHTDPKVIREISAAFEKGEFLQSVVPMPDDPQPEKNELGSLPNWYNWRVENWGCKWDVGGDGTLVRMSPNKIIISFDSPWAPPVEAYTTMALNGFDVVAMYFEPGMCFYGRFDNGIDSGSAYDDHNDIPSDIAEEFNTYDWFTDEED